MAIAFDGIPDDLMTPGVYVEFDNSMAVQGLTNQTNRIVLLAPKLKAGEATANVPVMVTSTADAKRLAGVGSIGAAMLCRIFDVTKTVETWFLPVEDPAGGAEAKRTITLSGSPTEAGTLSLYVTGTLVQVGVGVGDSADDIATAIADAIKAKSDLTVTAAASAKIVTVTSRHKGVVGSDLDIRVNFYDSQRTPAGLSVDIGAVTGGTGSHEIQDAIDALGATQYLTMISAFADDTALQIIEGELKKRWGHLFQNDSHCFIAKRGTVGEINSFLDQRNNEHMTCVVCEKDGEPQPTFEKAALLGALAAFYLGIDPARPLKELVMPGRLPSTVDVRFQREERNLLLASGAATTYVNEGGEVVVERCPTMYTKTSTGVNDISYQQTETMYTLSRLRYQVRARLLQRFPRHKLVGDDVEIPPGVAMVNPKIVRAELGNLASLWVEAGLIEDRKQFMNDLVVERDVNVPTRLKVLIAPNLVNQLFVIGVKTQFIL